MLGIYGEGLAFNHFAEATVLREDGSIVLPGMVLDLSQLSRGFGVGGTFRVECVKRNGRRRWVDDLKNGVVNSALDNILNVYLRNQTQIAAWYIGLIDNSGFTALAAGDTLAGHSGWSEFTSYSNTTRLTWSPGASSGQSVVNATSADFNITASGTIRGLFLASANDKGGTTGSLFSTAAFSGGNQAVNNGDTLKVTYTVGASST